MISGTRLEKYENYVNDVLRADLGKVCQDLDHANLDLAEYEQLGKTVEILSKYKEKEDTFKTMIDIGSNYFMQACVEDYSNILLDIGHGCYLEFSLKEAAVFIETKTKFLQKRIEQLREKSAKIKAHIKMILICMNKFYNPEPEPTR